MVRMVRPSVVRMESRVFRPGYCMNESRATRFQRGRRRAQAAGVVSGGVVLAMLALTPAGAGLASWATHLAEGWPWFVRASFALAAFTAACAALWELAWVPALWYLGSRVDTRHGRKSDRREAFISQLQAM